MTRRQSGFTLIELMVAALITAILFAMGYGAIQQALANREAVTRNADRLRSVQDTIRLLVQDLSQLAPRPVREPLGEGYQPALLATADSMALTRGGWMNPAGVQRSTLQRVRYVLQDGSLYREQWPVLDALLDPPPVRRELVDEVKSFRIRYMNDGRNWQDTWPPPAQSGARTEKELRWRPIAVEVTLELADWGKIVRLVEVPG